MTEDEAKHKWCPHIRLHSDAEMEWRTNRGLQPRGSNNDEIYGYFSCLGSSCMAWRWHKRTPHQTDGYCGLAGEP